MDQRYQLKYLLAMLLAMSSCLAVHAQLPQNLSFSFEQTNLKAALNEIATQTNCTFAYEDALIDGQKVKALRVENKSLDYLLTELLTPCGLSFSLEDYPFIPIMELAGDTLGMLEEEVVRSICGYVMDASAKERLPFATVRLLRKTVGTTTNETGYFEFKSKMLATDSVEVSYLGYEARRLPIRLFDEGRCPDIFLAYAEISMPDVIVKDRAITLLQAEKNGGGYLLRPKKAGLVPGWGDTDLMRMAQLVPGISSSDESASGLSVRGGTPDQNLVLWDGIPIYHTGHFFGMFSAFNPELVDQVAVFRGGFGAKYGGRVAGLIEITSEPARVDTFEWGLGFDAIGYNIFVSTPMFKKKAALKVALRGSVTENLQNQTYQKLFKQIAANGRIGEREEALQNGREDFTAYPFFKFSDFNLKWLFAPSDRTEASITVYAGGDDFRYEVRSLDTNRFFQTRDRVNAANVGTSLNFRQRWSKDVETRINVVVSNYAAELASSYTLDSLVDYQAIGRLTNSSTEGYLRIDNQYWISERQQLNMGYQFTGNTARIRLSSEDLIQSRVDTFNSNFTGTVNTVYADYDYHISDKISLDFGLRYNIFKTQNRNLLGPRFSLDWQPFGRAFHVKLAGGRYHQFASQIVESNELGLGEQLWVMAKEDTIPVVRSNQFSLGAFWSKNGWLLDGEFYHKRVDGLTTLRLRYNTNEGERRFSYGQAKISGFDLLLKKKWKKINSWLGYSYANVLYRFDTVNEGNYFPASHDKRHEINWTNIYNSKHWDLAFNVNLSSGRPYTPVQRLDEGYDEEKEEIYYRIIYEDRNSARLPLYQRVDVSAAYKYEHRKGGGGKIGLSIFNFFDRINVRSRDYIVEAPNASRPSAKITQLDRHLLRVTPNIFLQFKW